MKYYLVLELRPNDFMPIDINLLINSESHINYNDLLNIDMFTSQYSMDELKELVIRNNVVPNAYFNGKLKIINDNKYRFPIISSDINFNLLNYLMENIKDKKLMNKIKNIYCKYSTSDEYNHGLQICIDTGNYIDMTAMIRNLGYEKYRNICMYIINNIIESEKENDFIQFNSNVQRVKDKDNDLLEAA